MTNNRSTDNLLRTVNRACIFSSAEGIVEHLGQSLPPLPPRIVGSLINPVVANWVVHCISITAMLDFSVRPMI